MDYVADGVDARLVPPEDPRSLAAAIGELWEDAPAREKLARGGRQTEMARVRRFGEVFLRALTSATEGQ
jgi:glycosyltransferase involved in cell wall biosynthesis